MVYTGNEVIHGWEGFINLKAVLKINLGLGALKFVENCRFTLFLPLVTSGAGGVGLQYLSVCTCTVHLEPWTIVTICHQCC